MSQEQGVPQEQSRRLPITSEEETLTDLFIETLYDKEESNNPTETIKRFQSWRQETHRRFLDEPQTEKVDMLEIALNGLTIGRVSDVLDARLAALARRRKKVVAESVDTILLPRIAEAVRQAAQFDRMRAK